MIDFAGETQIMPECVFSDKAVKPDDKALNASLGGAFASWQEIRRRLRDSYGELSEEWKHYGPKTGWLMKVLQKKRNLFFFIPQEGFFAISFVFGKKAVLAVEASDLPDAIKRELNTARKYAEGRGIRIDVRSADEMETVLKLVEIKVKY